MVTKSKAVKQVKARKLVKPLAVGTRFKLMANPNIHPAKIGDTGTIKQNWSTGKGNDGLLENTYLVHIDGIEDGGMGWMVGDTDIEVIK
jgi:hypothetical protein